MTFDLTLYLRLTPAAMTIAYMVGAFAGPAVLFASREALGFISTAVHGKISRLGLGLVDQAKGLNVLSLSKGQGRPDRCNY